jgi:hypothetical protein
VRGVLDRGPAPDQEILLTNDTSQSKVESMTLIRTVTVKIEIETNKGSHQHTLELGVPDMDETLLEFAERVRGSIAADVREAVS